MPEESIVFTLPLELRIIIWQFAIVQDFPMDISEKTSTNKPHSLLSTCQQICGEVAPIYFEDDECQLQTPFNKTTRNQSIELNNLWLPAIGQDFCGMIKELEIMAAERKFNIKELDEVIFGPKWRTKRPSKTSVFIIVNNRLFPLHSAGIAITTINHTDSKKSDDIVFALYRM